MSTEKKARSAAEHADFSERVDRQAERLKQRESDMLNSARDAVQSGSERAESALHHATDATASAAKSANRHAADLGARGQEQWARGRDRAEDSLDQVLDYVRTNPGKSVAMAVAGGWLLGTILRRRR
ncbi:MAG: hypothetical protein WBW92_03810 [Rhodanobacteraceae bacterium]